MRTQIPLTTPLASLGAQFIQSRTQHVQRITQHAPPHPTPLTSCPSPGPQNTATPPCSRASYLCLPDDPHALLLHARSSASTHPLARNPLLASPPAHTATHPSPCACLRVLLAPSHSTHTIPTHLLSYLPAALRSSLPLTEPAQCCSSASLLTYSAVPPPTPLSTHSALSALCHSTGPD